MSEYAVTQLQMMLNKIRLSISGARIALLGLSYKANVGDIRESPSLKVIELLQALGADLVVYDPYFPKESTTTSLALAIQKADAVIVAVNHREFVNISASMLKAAKVLVVLDGKNCLDKQTINAQGILYKGIGR